MGGCVTRYRALSLEEDSFDDALQPGERKFYGITLTREWIERKRDLVVRVHVIKGRLQGVYCARDKAFPNQRRKLWEQERYCRCPSPSCDHCYPSCLNSAGGACLECMVHDDKWDRVAHEQALGGVAPEQGKIEGAAAAAAAASGAVEDPGAVELAAGAAADADDEGGAVRLLDPPYADQEGFEFSLRLSVRDEAAHLTTPGHFFLTVCAAEERVSKALRRQRAREGEAELHETLYSVWIEEALPKGDARAGNEARVAEVAARNVQRAKIVAERKEFGRRAAGKEENKQKQGEEEAMRALGLAGEAGGKKKASAATAAAAAPAAAEEKKGP